MKENKNNPGKVFFNRRPFAGITQTNWKSQPPSRGHLPYKVGGKTFFPGNSANRGDYDAICKLLSTLKDIRCHICWQCSVSKVYDKNNKEYKVSRGMTLAQVEELIIEIRKINESNG